MIGNFPKMDFHDGWYKNVDNISKVCYHTHRQWH